MPIIQENLDMSKNNMTILVGISGAGKSMISNQIANANKKTIIVNRDSIRTSLFGLDPYDHSSYYKDFKQIKEREKIVTYNSHDIIACAFNHNHDVILDNTHLKVSFIKEFLENWEDNFDVQIRILSIDLETAIQRDADRQRTVGRRVIEKQYDQLKSLLFNPEFKKLHEKYGI